MFLSIIAGIANFCGLVKSGNLSLNQFRTGGQSISRRSSASCGLSRYLSLPFYFTTPMVRIECNNYLETSPISSEIIFFQSNNLYWVRRSKHSPTGHCSHTMPLVNLLKTNLVTCQAFEIICYQS